MKTKYKVMYKQHDDVNKKHIGTNAASNILYNLTQSDNQIK